jgi:aspartyl aminopeptidase
MAFSILRRQRESSRCAKLIFNNRDRAAVLAVVGTESLESGSRLIATHQDSPHINLKAKPVVAAPGRRGFSGHQ